MRRRSLVLRVPGRGCAGGAVRSRRTPPDQHRPGTPPRSRRRRRTGSAPTISDATCWRACCTARASRSRSACCRRLVAGASGIAIGGVAGYAGGAVDARADARDRRDAGRAAAAAADDCGGASAADRSRCWSLLIGMAGWMETARVVRAEFRTLRARGFVEGARGAGAGHARLIVAHLLPNAAQAVIVSVTLAVARGILLESALSFFGVGVQPAGRRAGATCSTRRRPTLATEPWLALAPGAFHPADDRIGQRRRRSSRGPRTVRVTGHENTKSRNQIGFCAFVLSWLDFRAFMAAHGHSTTAMYQPGRTSCQLPPLRTIR